MRLSTVPHSFPFPLSNLFFPPSTTNISSCPPPTPPLIQSTVLGFASKTNPSHLQNHLLNLSHPKSSNKKHSLKLLAMFVIFRSVNCQNLASRVIVGLFRYQMMNTMLDWMHASTTCKEGSSSPRVQTLFLLKA